MVATGHDGSAAAAAGEGEEGGVWAGLGKMLRSLFMYWMISQVISTWTGSSNNRSPSSSSSSSSQQNAAPPLPIDPHTNQPITTYAPLWKSGTPFHIHVFLSESEVIPAARPTLDDHSLLWSTRYCFFDVIILIATD
jgi:hypothetical protein